MLALNLTDWHDVARLSDALVAAAEACREHTPQVAVQYTRLADAIEDALGECPDSVFAAEIRLARAKRQELRGGLAVAS